MDRLSRKSLWFFVLLLLPGCANHVSVDYDRAVRFSDYKTYVLLAKSEKSTEDARLNSPLIDKRIAAAIKQELASKGFGQQPAGPDFHVRYQINLTQEIAGDTSGVTMVFGSGLGRTGFGMGYSVPHEDVETYDKCMLTIDILAASSEELLWRGTSLRRMAETRTAASLDAFFEGLVKEILVKFPPSD